MTFHVLHRHRPVLFEPDRVAVSIYRSRAGPGEYCSRVCIAMYPAVLAATGWKVRDRLAIDVGRDGDRGKVRLRRNEREGRVLRRPDRRGRRLQLMCAAWPGLPDLARATAVTWRVGRAQGELEIDLPENWLRPG